MVRQQFYDNYQNSTLDVDRIVNYAKRVAAETGAKKAFDFETISIKRTRRVPYRSWFATKYRIEEYDEEVSQKAAAGHWIIGSRISKWTETIGGDLTENTHNYSYRLNEDGSLVVVKKFGLKVCSRVMDGSSGAAKRMFPASLHTK